MTSIWATRIKSGATMVKVKTPDIRMTTRSDSKTPSDQATA